MANFNLDEVFIFEGFSDESINRLKEIWIAKEASRGETLLVAGKIVQGLFILTGGEVKVELDGRILAKIKKGGVFGEMSFLGNNEDASATIKVESEKASFFLCERQVFLNEIEKNDKFCRDFYKGMALLISERLRHTNEKISTELKLGFSNISELINELDENSKIDQTRESLDKTGAHIVTKLMETMPKIEELKRLHPEDDSKFETILKNLREIMMEDTQTFDRICQKIDQLKQYFDNLKTIVSGAGVFGIKGDKNLFTQNAAQESTIEFL